MVWFKTVVWSYDFVYSCQNNTLNCPYASLINLLAEVIYYREYMYLLIYRTFIFFKNTFVLVLFCNFCLQNFFLTIVSCSLDFLPCSWTLSNQYTCKKRDVFWKLLIDQISKIWILNSIFFLFLLLKWKYKFMGFLSENRYIAT